MYLKCETLGISIRSIESFKSVLLSGYEKVQRSAEEKKHLTSLSEQFW